MFNTIWDYLDVALKLVVGLGTFLLLLRTTNKGQLSQMTPIDLIGNFVLGGIIGGVIYNRDIHVTEFIIVLAIWEVLIISLNFIRKNSVSGRKIIVGTETSLIINGKFQQEKFKAAGLDIGDFAVMLRMQGVHSMHDIQHALLEPNGHLSLTMKEDPKRSGLVVKNGSIDEGALELLGRDKAWLEQELRKAGYEDITPIFLAEWNEDEDSKRHKTGKLFIVENTDADGTAAKTGGSAAKTGGTATKAS